MLGHFSSQGPAMDFYKQKLRMQLKPFNRDLLDGLWKETSVRYSNEDFVKSYGLEAVSYTHLTLPTNREV